MARIDEKGRLKIPTPFRRVFDEKYSAEFFVTSIIGESVLIYPLSEWESLEERLAVMPSMEPAIRKFIEHTNYFGQQLSLDANGRLVIPSILRRSAAMIGEVAVMGRLFHLEVWEKERFERRRELNKFTAEDEAVLARYGI